MNVYEEKIYFKTDHFVVMMLDNKLEKNRSKKPYNISHNMKVSMNVGDNIKTNENVILHHKQKTFLSIFQVAVTSSTDVFNLKSAFRILSKRVHPGKINSVSVTLSQQNLLDAFQYLRKEEKTAEIGRKRLWEGNIVFREEGEEEKRKRERMRREKKKKDRIEEYESSSDDDGSIYLGGMKIIGKRKGEIGMKKRTVHINEVMVSMKKIPSS